MHDKDKRAINESNLLPDRLPGQNYTEMERGLSCPLTPTDTYIWEIYLAAVSALSLCQKINQILSITFCIHVVHKI
jgi:hypothetical protein